MKFQAQIAILFAALLVALPNLSGTLAGEPFAGQQDTGNKAAASAGQIPVALPKGKKLILTDGTFQLAREYKVEGDRVRYWSLERSQWEEIPTNLVDWEATHKDEAEQAAHDAELKAKIHASQMAQLTKEIDVDRSLEIKPGLFLPDAVGFYALDRNKLIREMKQSTAEVKTSTGREVEKIMTGVSMIPSKKTMDIPGERAALRLATAEPEFFMRPADSREPRFRLLRAQVKGGRRIIDNISIHFTGQEKHNATEIEIQTWTRATGVFRYTVDQRLEPGEYAFVETTDEGTSGYVWDFGIDLPGTKAK
ncbi:MAG TPA: hypothetical protein VK770_07070 [Candidatus Acidoferrum sp.]|nr:hypothetical protein [Candidatus Acidoferrum sp.]